MTLLALCLLAVVQGATEFLPVSSSGHLSLAHALLKIDEGGLLLDILLHAGTLVAVLVVYRRSLARLISDSLLALKRAPSVGVRESLRLHPGGQLALFVLAATIPTAVIGLALKGWVEGSLRHPAAVGGMLLLNGFILWSTRRHTVEAENTSTEVVSSSPQIEGLSWKTALIIGALQGLAVVPGISRSGTTIAAALWLGVEGAEAARFSFLLSIPAILGALVLTLKDLDATSAGLSWGSALFSAAVAAVVGYVCLRWLVGLLKRARFHHFAWYSWGLGAVALAVGLW